MGETIVRAANVDDADAIVALQRQIHADHLAGDPLRWRTTRPIDAVYPAWIRSLADGSADGLALVATDANAVVGYLIAEVEAESTKHWSPACLYFHDLFVAPPHRRTGVAGRMVAGLFAWRDTQRPTLPIRLITAAANEPARAFFARFGFRPATVELIEDRPRGELSPA